MKEQCYWFYSSSQCGCPVHLIRAKVIIMTHQSYLHTMATSSRPSSDLAAFRKLLASAKSVVVLTGAGVSAESGVPTFRGAGGFWRQYQVGSRSVLIRIEVAAGSRPSHSWSILQGPLPCLGVLPLQKRGEMPRKDASSKNNSLHLYTCMQVMLSKSPNPAHLAIAECAERLKGEGRRLRVITQVRQQPLAGKGKNAAVRYHENSVTTIRWRLGRSRPSGGKAQQDCGTRIQSGRYFLKCSQCLTSRLRRSARKF